MQSKLPATGLSIFSVMTQLSMDCGAINLSQGFPGFNPDPRLLDLVVKYLHGDANQYAPLSGVPILCNNIGKKVLQLYGRTVDAATEVTVCNGATEGLFCTIHAVVNAGDEVIVFDPAYDSYEPAVTLAGGVTRHLPLVRSESRPDYHVDWQQLAETINNRTRLIILNFPHNPTGAIFTREDLDSLADVVRDTSVYLLSDEVYEHIVFDGEIHHSLLCHDELWQRTFIVSSFGKTYHATGWKVGYCIAPQNLSTEFRQIHQWTCYSIVTPIQHALADYMEMTPEHYRELPAFYQQKRDRFCELVAKSRFTFTPAAGTFFQVLDYADISDEDDVSYSRRLTQEIGVASIPISVFYAEPPDDKKLRFCFAKDDAILEEAANKLCQL